MSDTFEIEGFEELINSLNIMPSKIESVENVALTVVGELVRGRAEGKLPRSNAKGRRHLKENVKLTKPKMVNGEKVVYVYLPKKLFWGKMLEWGTQRTRAQPFMQPAFEESENEILGIIKTAVNGVI